MLVKSGKCGRIRWVTDFKSNNVIKSVRKIHFLFNYSSMKNIIIFRCIFENVDKIIAKFNTTISKIRWECEMSLYFHRICRKKPIIERNCLTVIEFIITEDVVTKHSDMLSIDPPVNFPAFLFLFFFFCNIFKFQTKSTI